MYRNPTLFAPRAASAAASLLFTCSRCLLNIQHMTIAVPDVAMQIPYEFTYVGPHPLGHTYLRPSASPKRPQYVTHDPATFPQLRERVDQRQRNCSLRRRSRKRVAHPRIEHYEPRVRLRHQETGPSQPLSPSAKCPAYNEIYRAAVFIVLMEITNPKIPAARDPTIW